MRTAARVGVGVGVRGGFAALVPLIPAQHAARDQAIARYQAQVALQARRAQHEAQRQAIPWPAALQAGLGGGAGQQVAGVLAGGGMQMEAVLRAEAAPHGWGALRPAQPHRGGRPRVAKQPSLHEQLMNFKKR